MEYWDDAAPQYSIFPVLHHQLFIFTRALVPH